MIKMMGGKSIVEDNRIATLPFKDDIQMIIEPSKNALNQWQFINILPGSDRQIIVGDGYYFADDSVFKFNGLNNELININDGNQDRIVRLDNDGFLEGSKYTGYINTITHTTSNGEYKLYMRCDQTVGNILNNYVASPVLVTVDIHQDVPFHVQNLATLSTTKNKGGYIIDKNTGTHHTKMVDERLMQLDFESTYNLDDYYTVDSNGNSLLGKVNYKAISSYVNITLPSNLMISLAEPITTETAQNIKINGTIEIERNASTLQHMENNGVDSIYYIPFTTGGTLASLVIDGVTIYPSYGNLKDINNQVYGMITDLGYSALDEQDFGALSGGPGIMLPYCYDIFQIFSDEINEFDNDNKEHWGENDGYFEPISIRDLNIYAIKSNLFFGNSTIDNYSGTQKFLSTILIYNQIKYGIDLVSINKYIDRSKRYVEL